MAKAVPTNAYHARMRKMQMLNVDVDVKLLLGIEMYLSIEKDSLEASLNALESRFPTTRYSEYELDKEHEVR